MKVRESAMGRWFETLGPDFAVAYVEECLRQQASSTNVFWAIVSHYNLKAATPKDLAVAVCKHLMDFELDRMDKDDQEDTE